MNTYLAIITTVLVATQVIRVTQNYIRLRRLSIKQRDFQLQRDFQIQREVFHMLHHELSRLEDEESDEEVYTLKGDRL